ncbi:phosphotransferase, partial [Streptomyces specialis]|uniref:phosphotransferase n=1 Tax=Streptomyces specialis TaxID=498367 RepID=UPI00073EB747
VVDVGGKDRHALVRAMDAAAALRDERGLGFVVAPLRTAAGRAVRWFGDRYAVSVFPFVAGATGRFGQELTAAERGPLLDALAAMHRTAPPAGVPVARPGLSGGDRLAAALAEVNVPWRGGPFAEPARALLAGYAGAVRRRLAEFGERAAVLEGRAAVVTHGEPHPGNVLWAGGRCLLVDWDTVGLAVPERDLWLVARDAADLARYAEACGHRPDGAALAFYRLRWDLEDVAELVGWFRSPHGRSPDTEQAWAGLTDTLERLAGGGAAPPPGW